jgi:hypothetical protein
LQLLLADSVTPDNLFSSAPLKGAVGNGVPGVVNADEEQQQDAALSFFGRNSQTKTFTRR